MFSFKQASTLLFFGATALSAAEANYPITPNEVAGVKNLGPGINTRDSEYTPFITPDEKYLFFQSNREPSAGPEGDFDLWYSKNTAKNRGVDEPVFDIAANVGLPVNSASLDGHPTLRKLPNGEHEMYFSSFASATRPGPALTNIYHTVWTGGKWSDPVPVAEINSDFHDRMPSISEDGKFLFFSSDRLGGKGGDDIWVSEMDAVTGKWGAPRNAGAINTAASEVTPAIHSDGITLYFSSNHSGGVGGYDIYFTQSISRLADAEAKDIISEGWSAPLNLGKPFNSEFDDEYPTVTALGDRVYFTSNRPEGLGAFDIYRAVVPLFARPVMRVSLKGKTFSGSGDKIVAAKVQITAGNFKANAETSPEKKGVYGLNLATQKQYEIVVEAPGYRTIKETLDTRPIHQSQVIEKDFRLVRDIKLPKTLKLEMSFADPAGKSVSPQGKYRLLPVGKKTKALKIFKSKALVTILNTADFKSEEAAIAALDGYVVEVQAKKKGLPALEMRKAFSEILDQYQGQIPETVAVKFVMGEKKVQAEKPKPAEKPVAKAEKEEKAEEDKDKKETVKPAAKTTLKFLGRLYFATNVSDKLTGNDEAFLKSVAKRTKSTPGQKLVIIGHSDSRGTKPYNHRLAKQRAEYAKKLLIEKGVPAKRISVRSAGKSQRRFVDDNSETKRQKNRRADLYITVAVVVEDAAADVKPATKPDAPAAAKPETAKEDKPAPEATKDDKPAAEAEKPN
jgi:peptidoglycan-associated lipoprotein